MIKVAKYKLFLILALASIILAACGGSSVQSPGVESGVVQENGEEIKQPQQEEIDQPQQEEIDQPQQESSDADPIPMEVEPTAEIVRAPRAGLEASDPTTVNLASGKPALVEFFAFW